MFNIGLSDMFDGRRGIRSLAMVAPQRSPGRRVHAALLARPRRAGSPDPAAGFFLARQGAAAQGGLSECMGAIPPLRFRM